jgi:hypothetical protein
VVPDLFPEIGETGERDGDLPDTKREGFRFVEDVDVRMSEEEGIRDPGSFVIPRDNNDRRSTPGDLEERLKRLGNMDCRNSAPIEEIAAVKHEVDFVPEGRFQCPLEVGKEIRTPSPTLDSWMEGLIDAEMGIGQKEYPYRCRHLARS